MTDGLYKRAVSLAAVRAAIQSALSRAEEQGRGLDPRERYKLDRIMAHLMLRDVGSELETTLDPRKKRVMHQFMQGQDPAAERAIVEALGGGKPVLKDLSPAARAAVAAVARRKSYEMRLLPESERFKITEVAAPRGPLAELMGRKWLRDVWLSAPGSEKAGGFGSFRLGTTPTGVTALEDLRDLGRAADAPKVAGPVAGVMARFNPLARALRGGASAGRAKWLETKGVRFIPFHDLTYFIPGFKTAVANTRGGEAGLFKVMDDLSVKASWLLGAEVKILPIMRPTGTSAEAGRLRRYIRHMVESDPDWRAGRKVLLNELDFLSNMSKVFDTDPIFRRLGAYTRDIQLYGLPSKAGITFSSDPRDVHKLSEAAMMGHYAPGYMAATKGGFGVPGGVAVEGGRLPGSGAVVVKSVGGQASRPRVVDRAGLVVAAPESVARYNPYTKIVQSAIDIPKGPEPRTFLQKLLYGFGEPFKGATKREYRVTTRAGEVVGVTPKGHKGWVPGLGLASLTTGKLTHRHDELASAARDIIAKLPEEYAKQPLSFDMVLDLKGRPRVVETNIGGFGAADLAVLERNPLMLARRILKSPETRGGALPAIAAAGLASSLAIPAAAGLAYLGGGSDWARQSRFPDYAAALMGPAGHAMVGAIRGRRTGESVKKSLAGVGGSVAGGLLGAAPGAALGMYGLSRMAEKKMVPVETAIAKILSNTLTAKAARDIYKMSPAGWRGLLIGAPLALAGGYAGMAEGGRLATK